jgi:putative YhbY family RNA-binding protein
MALTPSRRSELRSEAHALTPVVIIGDKGLTDEVMAEIDRSLKAHELIKVRANTNDRDARELWMEKICERLDAHAVQQIGKILVVYRQNFDKPRDKQSAEAEDLPAKKKRSGTGRSAQAKARGAEAPRGGRDYSYFTSTISYSFNPPGVRISATSPEYFPMIPLAIGDE